MQLALENPQVQAVERHLQRGVAAVEGIDELVVEADRGIVQERAEALFFQYLGERLLQRTTRKLMLTEFGATDKLDVIRRVVAGADGVGVGWLYWQYKTYGDPTTSAASEGPDAESIVTPAGAVKAAKARELARPYPMRLAGRHGHWRYRPGDGRFTLRWTAVRGADTVVALPRLAYPHGSAVRAHGVRVVRRAPLTLRG